MKTKAAILVEQNKELVVDEVEIPKLEHGKALVEIKSTRICGSQLGEIDGVKGPDHYLPHLLGHGDRFFQPDAEKIGNRQKGQPLRKGRASLDLAGCV